MFVTSPKCRFFIPQWFENICFWDYSLSLSICCKKYEIWKALKSSLWKWQDSISNISCCCKRCTKNVSKRVGNNNRLFCCRRGWWGVWRRERGDRWWGHRGRSRRGGNQHREWRQWQNRAAPSRRCSGHWEIRNMWHLDRAVQVKSQVWSITPVLAWDTFQPGNKRRMITREKKNTGNCLHFNTLCCNMHFVPRCKTYFLRLYTFFAQWCIHPFSDFKSQALLPQYKHPKESCEVRTLTHDYKIYGLH